MTTEALAFLILHENLHCPKKKRTHSLVHIGDQQPEDRASRPAGWNGPGSPGHRRPAGSPDQSRAPIYLPSCKSKPRPLSASGAVTISGDAWPRPCCRPTTRLLPLLSAQEAGSCLAEPWQCCELSVLTGGSASLLSLSGPVRLSSCLAVV